MQCECMCNNKQVSSKYWNGLYAFLFLLLVKIHSYEGYDSSAIKTYGKQIVNNIDNLTDFY